MRTVRCPHPRVPRPTRSLLAGVTGVLAVAATVVGCAPTPTATTIAYPLSPKSQSWTPSTWSQDMGVDINAPCGTSLVAAASGTIIAEGIGGFGPYAPELLVDSGPLAGRMLYYGHVQEDLVAVGEHVSSGQPIAEVGTLGISFGCHVEVGISAPGSTALPGWNETSAEMLTLLTDAYNG